MFIFLKFRNSQHEVRYLDMSMQQYWAYLQFDHSGPKYFLPRNLTATRTSTAHRGTCSSPVAAPLDTSLMSYACCL